MDNAKGKAVLYARVSTLEQAAEGISIEAQIARGRAYAALRELEIVAEVIDAGVSAGKPFQDRPGGARVAALLRPGMALIVQDLSRYTRAATSGMALLEAWRDRGIAVHLVNEGGNAIDLSSPSGWALVYFQLGFADYTRQVISLNTRVALGHKRAKGESIGATPYGYDKIEGRIVPNSTEQAVIRNMAAWRAEGMELHAIAAKLTGQGVPLKQGGTKWTRQQVSRILARHEGTELTIAA